jgi:hypothetical protein
MAQTLIIKTNASQATDYLIDDVGIYIPNSGGQESFDSQDNAKAIAQLIKSKDLRDALTDDAFGAGSSTLILNDGSGDVAQADAENYLDGIMQQDHASDYGFVRNNEAGKVENDVTGDGTAELIDWNLGSDLDAQSTYHVTNLPDPTDPGDSASKNYVDNLVVANRAWKEIVLVDEQLDSANDAVSQAGVFYLDGPPVATNTFIITDGTTTETFTFKASETVAFDVAIGGDADATMANLAQAINDDSTLWSAIRAEGLEEINDGSGSSTAGYVVAIYRTNQSSASFTDRFYGTLGTQSFGQYVSFNGQGDYGYSTSTQLSTTDTSQKDFGFGRITSALVDNETHTSRNSDAVFTWDSDDNVWQNVGTASIIAGAGLTKSQNTLNVGAGNGIIVNADDVEVDYGETGDINEIGASGSNAAGSLDEAARADHVHAHADLSASSSTYHDGASVTTPAGLTNIGSPTEADTAFTNINDNFDDSQYVGKVLQFGGNTKVPASGTKFLSGPGGSVGSAAPIYMLRS